MNSRPCSDFPKTPEKVAEIRAEAAKGIERGDVRLVVEILEKLTAGDDTKGCRLVLELLRELSVRFPNQIPFRLEYARQLQLSGQGERAREVWERLLEGDPELVVARFNLARSLAESGATEAAAVHYEILLRQDPHNNDARYNLANLRQRQGDFAAAVTLYQELLRSRPEWVEVWINLALAYKWLQRSHLARACLEQALLIDPENVLAHWNLSLVLLQAGCWSIGWREFAWRLRRQQAFVPGLIATIPEWRGESLEGRRFLLWSEQGAGDAIQFVRYVGALPEKPMETVIVCQSPLVRLLEHARGVDRVLSYSEPPPAADFQLSLLSLPERLGVQNVTPPVSSYIHLPDGIRRQYADSLGMIVAPAVALVWAGNPYHENDGNRSLSPELLVPLSELTGIHFYSLQKEIVPGALPDWREQLPGVIDLAPRLDDFAATAVFLERFDLLITVDTAIVHLAGSLGRPAWLLLPFIADWRWQDTGETSSWYSSLRLFRQPSPGDWDSVISEVRRELAARFPGRQVLPHMHKRSRSL